MVLTFTLGVFRYRRQETCKRTRDQLNWETGKVSRIKCDHRVSRGSFAAEFWL